MAGSVPPSIPPSSVEPSSAPAWGRAIVRTVDRMIGGELPGTVVLSALVGLIAAAACCVLLAGFGETARLVFGSSDAASPAASAGWPVRLLVPAAGGLACGVIVRALGRDAFGQDVPELIDGVARRGGRVNAGRALVKSVAAVFTIGSGGSVGPEGPVVHAGGALASAASDRVLGLEGQRLKVVVAAGASAGIAALFDAPLAGILFSAEVILRAVQVRALVPLAVAAATATVARGAIADAGLPIAALVLPPVGPLDTWELAPCVVLGLAGGIVGVVFSHGVHLFEDVLEAAPVPMWVLPAIGGLVVGAMGLVMPEVMGSGYGTIARFAGGGAPVESMGIAVVAALVVWKFLATSITMASGGAGGVFAPALLMGAALGTAFGAGVAALAGGSLPVASTGTWAVIGMGAVLAAATHATLTATVLVFEMSRDPHHLLPLLLAAVAAVVVSTLLSRDTVHTLTLRRRGHRPPRASAWGEMVHETPVSALVRTDARHIGPGEPLTRLVKRAMEGGESLCQHVVDDGGKLLGTVSLQEVGPLLREDGLDGLLVAHDVMRAPPVSVTRADSLATCLERFAQVDIEELPVVDGAGTLVGRITRKDVLAFYARESLDEKALGLKFVIQPAAGAAAVEGAPSVVSNFVEVPPDHLVEGLTVPPGFVGKSLKDLGLRARFGVNVVGMRRRTPAGGRVSFVAPDPDMPMRSGDILILAGPKAQVERLMGLVATPKERKSGEGEADGGD